MSWLVHHTRSEEYAKQAEELLRQEQPSRAVEYYRIAADAELLALESLDSRKVRTLGITIVSAASLYYKAQEYNQAKLLAHKWLATGNLPSFAVDQLEELLQVIHYTEARNKSGIVGEVLVSVSGGEILYGAAPLELVLRKAEQIRSILYRTTELLLNLPLRTRGEPTREVKHQCDPWLLQAPPGSYQFAVRVRKPQKYQPENTNRDLQVDEITNKFLEIIKAAAHDPEGELQEVVPQEDYRRTFLKLTRELAPPSSGRSFEQIELRTSNESQPIVLGLDTRATIKGMLIPDQTRQLTGTLRALNLDRDWIEVSINGENTRIYDAKDEIDDVIGSMINHRVVVDVVEQLGEVYSLRDIQLEEDLV